MASVRYIQLIIERTGLPYTPDQYEEEYYAALNEKAGALAG